MRATVCPAARSLSGTVAVPGDKSLSHRAAMLAACASGRSHLSNFAPGDDCAFTLLALERLGARVERAGGAVVVDSPGWDGWREPEDALDCGDSGTTMRLLCGLLAAQEGFFVLTGGRSLRRRPMRRVVEPLRRMGARIDGRGEGTLAPLAIRGAPLVGAAFSLAVASAQVKSCLLFAGLRAAGTTWVDEPCPSRDHTERLLPLAGVEVLREPAGGGPDGHRPRVGVRGMVAALAPIDLAIPGDPSAAAFFAAAAALVPGSRVLLPGVAVNPTRTGFFEVLQAMSGGRALAQAAAGAGGAPATGGAAPPAGFGGGPPAGSAVAATRGPEPTADIEATGHSDPLCAAEVEPAAVPAMIDELPLLAVLATQARGVTRVRGAAELRHKESDRLEATAAELGRLGARIVERPDGWDIAGPAALEGGVVCSRGDHRLAMALAVAALAARGPVTIEDAGCVAMSYPAFFEDLRRLGARVDLAPEAGEE